MPALFERLHRRALTIAELRRRELARLVAEQLAGRISGIEAVAEGDRVILTGRSLRRRWLADGQLRFLGELIR